MRHIDHLPHIQYIVAHQSTIIYRKRKCQLNRNQQANLIKVKYKAKVLIPSWIFLRNTAQQVKFSLRISPVNVTKSAANGFAEDILNGKLHFSVQ